MAGQIESGQGLLEQALAEAIRGAMQDAFLDLGAQELSRIEAVAALSNVPMEFYWAQGGIRVDLVAQGKTSEQVFLEMWQRIFQEAAPSPRYARFGITYGSAISAVKQWQELDRALFDTRNVIYSSDVLPEDPVFDQLAGIDEQVREYKETAQTCVAYHVMNERGLDVGLKRKQVSLGKLQKKVRPDDPERLMTQVIARVEAHFVDPNQIARLRLLSMHDRI